MNCIVYKVFRTVAECNYILPSHCAASTLRLAQRLPGQRAARVQSASKPRANLVVTLPVRRAQVEIAVILLLQVHGILTAQDGYRARGNRCRGS